MPAALGQAAPGGVVARLVAAPAALGPVVPDAVPRYDSSPCPCGSSGRRRCARPRRSHGRGGEPVPAALLVRTAAPGRGLRPGRGIVGETHVGAGAVEGAPPGSQDHRGRRRRAGRSGPVDSTRVAGLSLDPRGRASRSPGGPRDHAPGRRPRGPPGDLANPAGAGRDGTGTGPGPTTTPGPTPGWRGSGPGRPRPGPACVNCRSAQRNPGAGAGADPGPACAMRAQRDTVHPGSRRASPARRNPPALDPREPTSHNASPGDITRTTPRGRGRARAASPPMASPRDSPGGGDAQAKTRRAVAPTPAPARRRSHRSRRRVAPGTARPPPRRRSAGAPAAPPDRSPEEP